jgi:hypothetical protein
MPIRIQSDLPAKAELEDENIFVMDENRALSQDFRELRIVILNLMPIKQDTELQLLRGLSNTPLQIDVTFLQMESHVSKNTSVSHLRYGIRILPRCPPRRWWCVSRFLPSASRCTVSRTAVLALPVRSAGCNSAKGQSSTTLIRGGYAR